MQVRDVMSKQPETVDEEATVREAVDRMVERGIGSVVVTRRGSSRPYKVGILTGTDVLELEHERRGGDHHDSTLGRLLDRLRPPTDSPLDGTTVGEVMSTPLVTISPDQSVEDAVELMRSEGVRHLVVTEQMRAVGVVTPTDVSEHHPEAVELARRLGSRGPDWGGE